MSVLSLSRQLGYLGAMKGPRRPTGALPAIELEAGGSTTFTVEYKREAECHGPRRLLYIVVPKSVITAAGGDLKMSLDDGLYPGTAIEVESLTIDGDGVIPVDGPISEVVGSPRKITGKFALAAGADPVSFTLGVGLFDIDSSR